MPLARREAVICEDTVNMTEGMAEERAAVVQCGTMGMVCIRVRVCVTVFQDRTQHDHIHLY